MVHFRFKEDDKRYFFLTYDTDLEFHILHDKLMEVMNPVDPICYLPTYSGPPFRDEFIWEYTQKNGKHVFYGAKGMWYPVWRWLKENNVEFDGIDPIYFKHSLKHTFDEFKAVVDSWGLSKTPRPYQYESAYKILQYGVSLSELATRAGKTMISYIVFRYMMEYMGAKKILMVVPSIELVKQGFADFKSYAEFFNAECIWSGGKVVQSSNLTIATYQSLVHYVTPKDKKYNPSFFDDYDVMFIDEVHTATAKSVKAIIDQPFMKSAKLVFGMSGTLPKQYTLESFCLHSLLGAKIQTIKTDDLIQQGYISPVHITQHRIRYADTDKQLKTWCKCAEYSISTFVEVPDPIDHRKKARVPLESPEFLIAYKKQFPFAYQRAKDVIFASGDTRENWLKYKKMMETAVKASTSANKLHVEVMMVHFFEERIDYLIEVLKSCPNNTLVLAHHTEYVKHIADRLRVAFPDRPVVAVYGSSKERKDAKTVLVDNDNAIMVANYKIMGTGITLNNLCYGVLFESFKSDSLNRQSIGRGLGLSDMKDKYILHDFTDVFDIKLASQKILSHGKERIKIYEEQNFPYDIKNVTI